MKKVLTLALVALMALSASAAKKKEATKNANKPVFTTIKENPITSEAMKLFGVYSLPS